MSSDDGIETLVIATPSAPVQENGNSHPVLQEVSLDIKVPPPVDTTPLPSFPPPHEASETGTEAKEEKQDERPATSTIPISSTEDEVKSSSETQVNSKEEAKEEKEEEKMEVNKHKEEVPKEDEKMEEEVSEEQNKQEKETEEKKEEKTTEETDEQKEESHEVVRRPRKRKKREESSKELDDSALEKRKLIPGHDAPISLYTHVHSYSNSSRIVSIALESLCSIITTRLFIHPWNVVICSNDAAH